MHRLTLAMHELDFIDHMHSEAGPTDVSFRDMRFEFEDGCLLACCSAKSDRSLPTRAMMIEAASTFERR
jgi:hypothetical protein